MWSGEKGRLIGYALYHEITQQRMGDLTLADVKAEGWEGMSLVDFKNTHVEGVKQNAILWVVRFTFLPLC